MEKKIYKATVSADGDEIYTLITQAKTNEEYLVECPVCGELLTVKWEEDEDGVVEFGWLAERECNHVDYVELDEDGWIYWRK